MSKRPKITPAANGPYALRNCDKITRMADGKVFEIDGKAALCRCGESKNKPFCDGTPYCPETGPTRQSSLAVQVKLFFPGIGSAE